MMNDSAERRRDPDRKPQDLPLRRVGIDTYRENVAFLHRDCPIYRVAGFQALSKIRITTDGRSLVAVLNVVDDDDLLKPDEVGLSSWAFDRFGAPEGTRVLLQHSEPPRSMDAVRRKFHGEPLLESDYHEIIQDIVSGKYSKMEISAFLVAVGQNNISREEVLYLTQAMIDSGERLNWDASLVVDKHCIGGIPGNRTTMVVVPIVAAHGMIIPKTSSRAITSSAGTADTMEVLSRVDLPPTRLHEIVRQTNGCLAWGGTTSLSPVDDILITVERPLAIDFPQQMVASILSKKVAAGSTHLLLDIPIGPTAKVRSRQDAMQLRKLFEFVGDRLGIHVEAMFTDGTQPIGNGIGPVLEARDVMMVLENKVDAPRDLKEKSLELAARILEFDPDIRGGGGYDIARDILESGRALEKMDEIIDAQGRNDKDLHPSSRHTDIHAEHEGTVTTIDNMIIGRIARLAGAPMDPCAGVDLFCKVGDRVTTGRPLFRIHAGNQAEFAFACDFARKHNAYTLDGTRS